MEKLQNVLGCTVCIWYFCLTPGEIIPAGTAAVRGDATAAGSRGHFSLPPSPLSTLIPTLLTII